MRIIILCAMVFLFASCHRAPLSCRSEYLYPEYLASANVLTPDPCSQCFYGQQIVVKWDVKRECLPAVNQSAATGERFVQRSGEKCGLQLVLHVRYGTREQAAFSWPINCSRGYRIYRLINDEYWCKEGIVSYKAELYKDGVLVSDWVHHLWVDIIEINL